MIEKNGLHTSLWNPVVDCGDGKVIEQIIVASIHSSSHSSTRRHCILAYDIDKELVMQCAETFVSSDDTSFSLQFEHFLEIAKDKV